MEIFLFVVNNFSFQIKRKLMLRFGVPNEANSESVKTFKLTKQAIKRKYSLLKKRKTKSNPMAGL
jgi:hypothetical protein